jgi:hypothetical protein
VWVWVWLECVGVIENSLDTDAPKNTQQNITTNQDLPQSLSGQALAKGPGCWSLLPAKTLLVPAGRPS